MKIVENSPDRLVIHVRPWTTILVFVTIAAVVLYAALNWTDEWSTRVMPLGAAVFLLMVAATHLSFTDVTFDRAAGEVVRRDWGPAGSKEERIGFASIDAAIVDITTRGKGGSQRLALLCGRLRRPLEPGYSAFDRARVAAEVNAWLGRTG